MLRLPAVDPSTRILLIFVFCSYAASPTWESPVYEQAYPSQHRCSFTTKYLGHCDYRSLRWEVIDTPGSLRAVAALAHLTCSALYFVGIPEQCGCTIEQQCNVFRSIPPFFANKQPIIDVNSLIIGLVCGLQTTLCSMISRMMTGSSMTFLRFSKVNIANYIDPEIEAKLEALEREEVQLAADLEAAAVDEELDSDLDEEEEIAAMAIRERQEYYPQGITHDGQ